MEEFLNRFLQMFALKLRQILLIVPGILPMINLKFIQSNPYILLLLLFISDTLAFVSGNPYTTHLTLFLRCLQGFYYTLFHESNKEFLLESLSLNIPLDISYERHQMYLVMFFFNTFYQNKL